MTLKEIDLLYLIFLAILLYLLQIGMGSEAIILIVVMFLFEIMDYYGKKGVNHVVI